MANSIGLTMPLSRVIHSLNFADFDAGQPLDSPRLAHVPFEGHGADSLHGGHGGWLSFLVVGVFGDREQRGVIDWRGLLHTIVATAIFWAGEDIIVGFYAYSVSFQIRPRQEPSLWRWRVGNDNMACERMA
jgi:hypothetical protein